MLDRLARPHLRQGIEQRAAGFMVLVAVPRVDALGRNESRAQDVVVTLDQPDRQQDGQQQESR